MKHLIMQDILYKLKQPYLSKYAAYCEFRKLETQGQKCFNCKCGFTREGDPYPHCIRNFYGTWVLGLE